MKIPQRIEKLGTWTKADLWPFLKLRTWPLGFAFLICAAHFTLRLEIMSMCSDGGLCARLEDNTAKLQANSCNSDASNALAKNDNQSPPDSPDSSPSEHREGVPWTKIALPENPWQKFAFGALLLSIFVAIAINFYSPDDYRALLIRDEWLALLISVIPTVQVLAVVVASLTVHNPRIHSVATLIYLWLFVAWDLIIINAKPIGRRTENGKGDQLVKRAKEYLGRIDLPFAFTFTLLFMIVLFIPEESPEPFVAGILSSQACAAASGLIIVLIDEFRRFKQERATGGAPTDNAPDPIMS